MNYKVLYLKYAIKLISGLIYKLFINKNMQLKYYKVLYLKYAIKLISGLISKLINSSSKLLKS